MRLIVVALLNSLDGARSIAAAAENDIFFNFASHGGNIFRMRWTNLKIAYVEFLQNSVYRISVDFSPSLFPKNKRGRLYGHTAY